MSPITWNSIQDHERCRPSNFRLLRKLLPNRTVFFCLYCSRAKGHWPILMPPGSKNFPSTRFLGRCILNFVAMSFKTSRISSLNCTFKLQNLRMNEQIEHCKIDCVRRKIVKFSIFAIKFEDFDRNCSKISWPSTVIIIEWQSYCAMWNMWKILEIRFWVAASYLLWKNVF